jgi:hypothetical protein
MIKEKDLNKLRLYNTPYVLGGPKLPAFYLASDGVVRFKRKKSELWIGSSSGGWRSFIVKVDGLRHLKQICRALRLKPSEDYRALRLKMAEEKFRRIAG